MLHKTRFLAPLLLLAFAGSAPALLTSPQNWTQFRLSNSNNAVVPGSLRVSWRISTGAAFSSSPSLADGLIFIGNNAGSLYAVDAASGKIAWIAHAGNPLMSAPLVVGNAVIVGEGNANSPPQSSPSRPIHVGKGPNALLAFNRETGALLWSTPLQGTGMPTPALVDGIVVHHDGAGNVTGVDPQSGREIYARSLGSFASMTSALPVAGGWFVTAGVDKNAVWLLRARDGSVRWKSSFSSMASGIGDCPPAADRRRLYCDYIMPPSTAIPVQTERTAIQRLYAIDLRTGKRVWDVVLERGMLPKRNEAAIPLLYNGRLYVGSSLAPYVHAIDPRTGKTLWRVHVHGAVKSGMVGYERKVFFGDLAGYLWALDAATGRVLGERYTGMRFNVGSPILAGRTLVIGSLGGTLLAIPISRILAQ